MSHVVSSPIQTGGYTCTRKASAVKDFLLQPVRTPPHYLFQRPWGDCLGIFIVALTVFSSGSALANTEKDFYVNIKGSISSAQDAFFALNDGKGTRTKIDSSNGVGIDLGYLPYENVRIEGGLTYQGERDIYQATHSHDAPYQGDEIEVIGEVFGTLNQLSFHGNLWYDITQAALADGRLVPYIGGGFSANRVNVALHHEYSNDIPDELSNWGSLDDTDWVWGYMVGGGLFYAVSDSVKVDLGYRFQDQRNAEFNTAIPQGSVVKVDSLKAHAILLGIRIHF